MTNVPGEGIEPSRPTGGQRILSPPRLPISSPGQMTGCYDGKAHAVAVLLPGLTTNTASTEARSSTRLWRDKLGHRRSRSETRVRGDDRRVEAARQLHVRRVDESDVSPPAPRACEERRELVPLDWRIGNTPEPITDPARRHLASTMQPSERREHLRIEVRRRVQLMTPEPAMDRRSQRGARQQVDHRRSIDDRSIRHGLRSRPWPLLPPRQRHRR